MSKLHVSTLLDVLGMRMISNGTRHLSAVSCMCGGKKEKKGITTVPPAMFLVVDSIIHNASSTCYVSQTLKGKGGMILYVCLLDQHLAEGGRSLTCEQGRFVPSRFPSAGSR